MSTISQRRSLWWLAAGPVLATLATAIALIAGQEISGTRAPYTCPAYYGPGQEFHALSGLLLFGLSGLLVIGIWVVTAIGIRSARVQGSSAAASIVGVAVLLVVVLGLDAHAFQLLDPCRSGLPHRTTQ